MPRRARQIVGGYVYHLLNRGNGRARLFWKDADYRAFERILEQARRRVPLRLVGYCLMPNHWHLVVWPRIGHGGDVSQFMRWLTVTHATRWRAHRHNRGDGHLYQGRFKSFPVEDDAHYLTLLRYVEANAYRAHLVERAEDWPWSSLWRLRSSDPEAVSLIDDGPLTRPSRWLATVNRTQREHELERLRRCVQRGQPFGGDRWTRRVVARLGLQHTLRRPGRPRKPKR